MNTNTIDPAIRNLATTTMTELQLEVWVLIHVHGYSIRAAATKLDIARSTCIDRYDAGCRRLRLAGATIDASGNYHLQETA